MSIHFIEDYIYDIHPNNSNSIITAEASECGECFNINVYMKYYDVPVVYIPCVYGTYKTKLKIQKINYNPFPF